MGLTRPRVYQINTTTTGLEDPIVVINQGSTIANVDIGFIMDRNNGSVSNVALYWSESSNTFITGFTGDAGTIRSNITLTNYANITVGSLFGNIGGGNAQANVFVTGALLPSSNVAYDLGSSNRRFKTLFLSGTTIDMDGKTITVDSEGNWSFSTGTGNQPVTFGYSTPFNVNYANISHTTTGNITVTDNTNTSGLGTGALIVSAGGASIEKDLYVGGNIYVANLISQNETILSVTAPLLYLQADESNYNYEIGFYSQLIGGPLNNYQHAGLVRNHLDNQWYFFSNLGEPSLGTVNLSNTAIIYDTVHAGGLILANTTAASSTVSGALQVSGGAGIAGSLYIGGALVANGTDIAANLGTATTNISTLQANVGAFEQYANANLGTATTNISTLQANVGAFEQYANANLGTATTNISTLFSNAASQADTLNLLEPNLGTATTNISTLFSNAASQQTAINSLVTNANANTAAYIAGANLTVTGINAGTYYGYINANVAQVAIQSQLIANTTAGTAYLTFAPVTSGNVALNATPSLTVNPATGLMSAYALSTTSTITGQGNIVAASGTISSSTTTGALVVSGGAGVSGNVFAGAVYTSGLYWASNNASMTGPASGSAGDIQYNNNGVLGASNLFYDVGTGNIVVKATTVSTTTTTGALVVTGGVGISGNAFIGNVLATGFFYANGSPFVSNDYGNTQVAAYLVNGTGNIAAANVTTTGKLVINDTTNSEPYVLGSGALYLAGGMSIAKDFWVGGNLYVANIVSQSSTILEVADPLVYLNSNSATYNYDIGVFSDLIGGPLNNYQFTAAARSYQTNSWNFASNIEKPANGQINFSNSSIIWDTVKSGNLILANTQQSSSTTTGVLVVGGGAGIAGNVNAGNVNAATVSGTTASFTYLGGTITASSQPNITNVGTLVDLDVSGTSTLSGFTTFQGAASGSEYTVTVKNGDGARLLVGTNNNPAFGITLDVSKFDGSGYAKQSFRSSEFRFNVSDGSAATVLNNALAIEANGIVVMYGTTTSTSTSSGALIVKGGLGVAGNVSADKFYTASGIYWSGNGASYSTGSGGGGGGITYTAAISPPGTPAIADQWYNTSTDTLYEYVNDGTTSYWVDIQSLGTTGNITTISDATLAGNLIVGVDSRYSIGAASGYVKDVYASTIVGNIVTVSGNIAANNATITSNLTVTQSGLFRGPYDENSTLSGVFVGNTGTGTPSPRIGFFNGNTQQNWQIDNFSGTFRWFVPGASKMILYDTGILNVTGGYTVGGKKAVNGPAFRAYISTGQTIASAGAQIKVTFGAETFDTDGCFASSTFTPTAEGYYQLNATVRISGPAGTGENMLILYKNGSEYARGTNGSGTEIGGNFYSMQVSDIAYANGTTDTFEVYIQQGSGSNKDTTAGQNISYFSGCMIRGA